MRITKKEYEQLLIFKKEFNLYTLYIMSDPMRFIHYSHWRSQFKDDDAGNS